MTKSECESVDCGTWDDDMLLTCETCNEMNKVLWNKLQAKNKDLRLLLNANKTANKAYEAENEKLRKFAKEWQGHESNCNSLDEGSFSSGCNCGYDEARKQALEGGRND